MNETTTAWTESRIARTAWQAVRHDLIEDAWALRPLPPLRSERFVRWPRIERIGGRWLPHATVAFLALFITMAEMSTRYSTSAPGNIIDFCLVLTQTLPVLLALLRPVGAFWASLAATVASPVTGEWGSPGIMALVTVMVLVALRSRPRVAVEMWLISVAAALLVDMVLNDGYRTVMFLPLAFFSAVLLATAVALRGWRQARGEVAEQETLVADVRGQHSLLEERARIARELHDVVAHHMSVIAIQAEAAPYRVSDPPEELTKSFGTIRSSAVEALAELRRVLGVLRFESADDQQLPDAPQPDLSRLDELVDGVRSVGLTVEVARFGAQRTLPQGVELSAFRIIQEGLSNALRHAPGSRVRVEVSYVLTGLGLRIVNTPPTAKVQPSPGMGHGVMGMRERAAMLGGELTAGPTADGGFEVSAFLPLDQPAEEATA
ncbi:sensor histidine kinase [Streptomyces sp. bgisy100]|uniref:sensor histidine kinase n=1 Tax=Streptomyces sp. bgisy100 TaxID=3413783 RepID=UPI003D744E82